MKKNEKFLFIGGHATPAFAVVDELLARGYKKDNFLWVSERSNQRGAKQDSFEYITVNSKYKIKFIEFSTGKLVRARSVSSVFRNILETFKLSYGFCSAFMIILKEKPTKVVSFGGFLAVPVVIWGRVFGAQVSTHEQTLTPGLANRIIAKFAHKVFVAWEDLNKSFPEHKVIFTGNPIRKDVLTVKTDITREFNDSLPIVYITGGNQGANEINKRVFEILPDLLKLVNVVHQTGNSTITNDFAKAKSIKEELPDDLKNRYIARDSIYADEIGSIMQKANLIVSRSGANTVTEILALGKLSILIPIPWVSGNEQYKNAKLVESVGLGKLLIQSNSLTPRILLDNIKTGIELSLLDKDYTGEKISVAKRRAKSLVRLDSAQLIVENLLT